MKTKTWLHFIGKSYYTINAFVKEAEKIGVSRAVAPAVLRKMSIGDIVILAQRDGASTKVFGYFVITTITGLNLGFIKTMCELGALEKQASLTPMRIKRGCGTYEITASYVIKDTDYLMKIISKLPDEDIGRAMIGGKFQDLSELGIPDDYVLTDIPFRKGYRLFDLKAFTDEFSLSYKPDATKHVKLRGQFYATADNNADVSYEVEDPKLLEIRNYQLN